ncbi:hypothetical protein [Paenibacillus sedimenti]|uniref:Uncharacterized protein n=1 Tax=Paenibacillus sedimenti TaxID=2770274 RepID=A0A926KWR0_9BACL|nr:hypothetical protein [Paenibacillus sedimenti]MBD0383564.1 hypothetical protein [Paenibacillus sedimenti]
MQRIFPVTEQTCIAHCGKQVLIYLYDGSEIYGTLSRVESGRLILNDTVAAVSSSSKKKPKGKAAKAKPNQNQATTQAWGPFGVPYGYGYGPYGFPPFGGFGYGAALAIELAAIAVLFAFLI